MSIMPGQQMWDISRIGFLQPTAVSGEPDSGSYRFFVVTHFIYIFSLVGHASFVVLFFLLSAELLSLYNIFSSLVFAAFYVAAVEVVLHSSLCALLIGWPTGFHYFIVGIIPFSILLADLDDFKLVNDRHGHGCGDAVLVSSAELLRRSLRGQDTVCRWGGEEFLIVLPETNADGARCVADNLLQRFRDHRILCGTVTVGVTITMGEVCCGINASVEQMIVCADRALYLGKGQGKDRVVLCRDTLGCVEPGCPPPVQTE